MLAKNQIRVLDLFRRNIFFKNSILDISNKVNKGAYQRVYEAIRELEKRGILKSEKIGNLNLISLLLTPRSISYLSFLDEQEAMNKKIPNYEKIMSLREISSYLIIVAGSYAKGKATKKSDLDVVIIIPDNERAIDVQKLVENLTLLFYPFIHLYVFNKKDFIEMLLEKNENYGKEIFRHHIILKNASIYYDILRGVIENGFQG